MFIARRFFPYLNECPQQTLTFNREFKETHFWGTNVNQKWVFFSFDMPWGHHICNAKFFLTLIETICPKMFSKLRLKSAKSPLSVDVRRSKTSLYKHPIFCCAPFLLTRLTAPGSPRMRTTTTWKYLISRHSFVEDVNKRQRIFLFSWTSVQSFRIQL